MNTVRRRRVFHITGYDSRPDAPYRLLRRELAVWQERFGRGSILSARRRIDAYEVNWTIAFEDGSAPVEVDYSILCWDDIVRQDRKRSAAGRAKAALATLWTTIGSGAYAHFWWANPRFAAVWTLPFVAYGWAMLLGVIVCFTVAGLGADWPVAVAVAVASSAAAVWLSGRISAETLFDLDAPSGTTSLGRIGQLFDLWIFACDYAVRRRPDIDRRLDRFAERIAETIASDAHDEILLVGHSLGAVLAIGVLDRLLSGRGPSGQPKHELALLTFGSLHELPAAYPEAAWLRQAIRRVARAPRLHWTEYADEYDPLSFPFGDFMQRLHLPRDDAIGNPHLRRAEFRTALTEATLHRIWLRPFRMHFQYVMANERPGPYDYFAIVGGRVPLRSFAETAASCALHTPS